MAFRRRVKQLDLRHLIVKKQVIPAFFMENNLLAYIFLSSIPHAKLAFKAPLFFVSLCYANLDQKIKTR